MMELGHLESLQNTFNGREWCKFTALSNTDATVELNIHIQDDLSWFAGHFPEQPVLPGVVQTHWACELAQHLFVLKGIQKVSNLKFKTMILPNTQCVLKMTFNAEKKSVSFVFANEETTFSTGSLVFSA
ncbi:MAG: hypothetical protein ACRBEE_11335 [Arenicella sp.]